MEDSLSLADEKDFGKKDTQIMNINYIDVFSKL